MTSITTQIVICTCTVHVDLKGHFQYSILFKIFNKILGYRAPTHKMKRFFFLQGLQTLLNCSHTCVHVHIKFASNAHLLTLCTTLLLCLPPHVCHKLWGQKSSGMHELWVRPKLLHHKHVELVWVTIGGGGPGTSWE